MKIACKSCGSTHIVFDENLNAFICTSCGVVLDEKPVYSGFESTGRTDSTPRYSGAFTNRVHDHGVGGTEISGNIITHVKSGRTWAAKHYDIRVDKSSRIVKKGLTELNELIKILKPPSSVQETAADLTSQTVKGMNYKEKTLRRIAAAALYLAYKIHNQPKVARAFAQEVGITMDDLWEGIRKIRESVKDFKIEPQKYDPRTYVTVIVKKLALPAEVEVLANKLLSATEETYLSGKSPASLAAASVYLASVISNNKRNQLEVGSSVGLTDVAVRNAYDAIVKNTYIDIIM
ncbi:MAG: transcription initiation factor IIB family protein [Thermosphaera sp.]